jgi:hypothetical protein
MWIFKFALLTCGFYLATTFLLQCVWLLIAWRKGEALLYGTRWGVALVFGLIWLLSFQLAWHFLLRQRHSSL